MAVCMYASFVSIPVAANTESGVFMTRIERDMKMDAVKAQTEDVFLQLFLHKFPDLFPEYPDRKGLVLNILKGQPWGRNRNYSLGSQRQTIEAERLFASPNVFASSYRNGEATKRVQTCLTGQAPIGRRTALIAGHVWTCL